jgi:hypothetical protein
MRILNSHQKCPLLLEYTTRDWVKKLWRESSPVIKDDQVIKTSAISILPTLRRTLRISDLNQL